MQLVEKAKSTIFYETCICVLPYEHREKGLLNCALRKLEQNVFVVNHAENREKANPTIKLITNWSKLNWLIPGRVRCHPPIRSILNELECWQLNPLQGLILSKRYYIIFPSHLIPCPHFCYRPSFIFTAIGLSWLDFFI